MAHGLPLIRWPPVSGKPRLAGWDAANLQLHSSLMGKLAEPDLWSDTGLWYQPPSGIHSSGLANGDAKLAPLSLNMLTLQTIVPFTWLSLVRLGFAVQGSVTKPSSHYINKILMVLVLTKTGISNSPEIAFSWKIKAQTEWACHHIMVTSWPPAARSSTAPRAVYRSP